MRHVISRYIHYVQFFELLVTADTPFARQLLDQVAWRRSVG